MTAMATQNIQAHTLWRFQLLFSDIPNPNKPHMFCKAQFNSPPKTHEDGELLWYSTYFTVRFKTQKSRLNSLIHIQCLTWSLELLSFIALGVYIAFCMTKQHCYQVQFHLCAFRYFHNQTPGPSKANRKGGKNYKQPNLSDLRLLSCSTTQAGPEFPRLS